MKKRVRTIWISILSGLAFIAACCCSQNKLPKDTPQEDQKKIKAEQLQHQLDSINTIIQRREGACVYGSPEIIEAYGQETRRLKQEAENIQNQLKELDNE